MLGAVIGDIVGSRFELAACRSTEFAFFDTACTFTDDTVCTAAVADWLLQAAQPDLARLMQDWCRRYPDCGYGSRFADWVASDAPQSYDSWGNGSAMRVSPVGWAFDSLAETLAYARRSAEITHNHPEGIRGAEVTAAAVFWARTGQDKAAIRCLLAQHFPGYVREESVEEIRKTYRFTEHCAETVPQALAAFFDSNDFEHAVRLAVSLGGDADTLAAIAGSVAQAYYGIPSELADAAAAYLPEDIRRVCTAFSARFACRSCR